MSSLAQQITAAGLADHILSERQLGNLLGGGDARRYGLVNRALKDGSLLRVKRGTYLLAKRYRAETIHPFSIAQGLMPCSYVSFESALAHRGWIPDAVFVNAGATPGRTPLRLSPTACGQSRITTPDIAVYNLRACLHRVHMAQLRPRVPHP